MFLSKHIYQVTRPIQSALNIFPYSQPYWFICKIKENEKPEDPEDENFGDEEPEEDLHELLGMITISFWLIRFWWIWEFFLFSCH